MTDVTKSCVRVLRFEQKIWAAIGIIIKPIINILIYLFNLINWCIFRSIARWIGIPVVIILCWSMVANISVSLLSGTILIYMVVYSVLISLSLSATLFSWIGIPEKERRILHGEDIITDGV